MSRFCCPHCGAGMELPDGLPFNVACPACGRDFSVRDAVAAPGGDVPGPGQDAVFRTDTAAITQPIAAAPPVRPPDPLGAYRGDTLAMTRGDPPRPPEPPPPGEEGERFGPFDLLEKLGSSDVAVTYRARRRAQGEIVALKVLAPGKTATSEEIAALLERARAASRLRHEGIAQVIEARRRDDADFIASEYVAGRTLAQMLDAGEPGVGEAVEMAREIAWALDHAHGAGVVHGNLKPSNVIVDGQGGPHLTDFGLARELWRIPPEDLRSAGGPGLPLPRYMPPEQLRGEAPAPRSDVYGLGALLYHMITRLPPFRSENVFELVLEIDGGGPVPPASVNVRVPLAVNAIVMKCLEREPRHRFASAGALASEIERFLHGQKVLTALPGAGTRLLRGLADRWRALVAVAVLAGAAAAGSWYVVRAGLLPERVAAVCGVPGGAESAIRRSDELARQGRWEEAAAKLSVLEARAELPARLRSMAAARLGVVQFRRGAFRDAAECLSRAIGIRPGDADLHYLYGVALWHSGAEPGKVASALRSAAGLDAARANSARFMYDYARACELAGDEAGAREAFRRVASLDASFRPELVSEHLARLGR